MPIGVKILLAIVIIGAVVPALIYVGRFTMKKLKDIIRKRLEQKEKSKVAFISTKKVVNKHAKEILAQAPSMTMRELEEFADESPYFIVDYDPETGKESNLTKIQAESAEEKVDDLFNENDGIILFD